MPTFKEILASNKSYSVNKFHSTPPMKLGQYKVETPAQKKTARRQRGLTAMKYILLGLQLFDRRRFPALTEVDNYHLYRPINQRRDEICIMEWISHLISRPTDIG